MSAAENPMFGGEDAGGDPSNPLFGGGDESPIAGGQVYGGGEEAPKEPTEFSNVFFGGQGILDSQDVRADEPANPLYETNQSQLSAPDSPGGYADAAAAAAGAAALAAGTSVGATSMMSARSRQESAREFPAANPLFTDVGVESDEDEMADATGAMANPMYQSAHSGAASSSRADLMATASSMGDGEYGDAAAAAEAPTTAAAARPSSSGQPFSNPLAGGVGEAEAEEEASGAGAGANPLFQQQQGSSKPPTNVGMKPAGYRR